MNIEQRNAPGRCCPDFKCAYPSWNGVECPECGKMCAGCSYQAGALEVKEELKHENEDAKKDD